MYTQKSHAPCIDKYNVYTCELLGLIVHALNEVNLYLVRLMVMHWGIIHACDCARDNHTRSDFWTISIEN